MTSGIEGEFVVGQNACGVVDLVFGGVPESSSEAIFSETEVGGPE